MASNGLYVSLEIQRAAVALFEKYRSDECRQQHKSLCTPRGAPGKDVFGDRVCTKDSERRGEAGCFCVVASFSPSKCFSNGRTTRRWPVILLPVSMADHQTVQDKSFVKDFTFNLLPAPLYDPGTTLLMADNGSGSEVIIEGRFWNFQKPKNDGLTSWEYLIRGRDDERISEYLLRSKVVKVLSGHGCEVKSKPAQQIEQAVQKDATAPPLAESRVEKHGSGNNSNILLEKASKCTNDAVDLFKRAAAHKRSAAELERDEADKIGAQMQDLVQERVQLEQKLADLKAREDVFATKKSELTDRADKLIKEVEGMESWLETGTSQSVAAESSIEDNHAAKRHRSE